ncbi:TPA: restriction endonuclease subunit S [Vibrio vulnificus]|nr:hypothetical protein [Vibrio vulnificus]HAS8441807.1 hypothetical protein [Vibrio vulnificus]HDY7539760.1 restriction endonuclease subunit S [Vibrio vulnificus]
MNLPSGWTEVTLDDVCSKITDGTHKTPKYQSSGVRFISIKNVKPFQKVNWSSYEKYISVEEHNELTKRCNPEFGDILFPRIGTLGYAKRVDFEEEVSLFVGLGLAKPIRSLITSKYLEYWMNSPDIYNLSHQKATGSGRLTLALAESKKLPVPLTSISMQNEIVEKIEELFSHIDAGVQGLHQAKAKLQQYRQSVLKDAVTGKLTEQWREQNADKLEPASALLDRILDERRASWEAEQLKAFEEKGKTPKNDKWKDKYKAPKSFNQKEQPLVVPSAWEWCYFESLGVVSGGLTKNSKRKSFEKKLPYLRVANVYANELRLDDIQEIGVTDTELDRVLLEDKDLLIVEGNGSPDQIGRLAVWDDSISPCVHQNHLIKVRLIDKALCDFVVYWLMSLPGREQIKSVASSTSGLYTLSISKISGLPVPLPPINEAIEISKLVTDKLEAAQRTEDELSKKIKHSEQLKSSILSKAFSGQLVENHATDETAEQLLGKIRLEKDQVEQKAKLAKKKPTARAKKMKRRPIIDVLMESKKPLNVDELFELSGFQGEVTPEVVEEFYQELKDVTATKGVNVTSVKVDDVKQGDLFEYEEIKPDEA